MTYHEMKDLIRALRFQFYGEQDAARKEAERHGWERPRLGSFYDYVAHRHGWRYVLTAHGIGRADLDGSED
jgi:hypothetical protein